MGGASSQAVWREWLIFRPCYQAQQPRGPLISPPSVWQTNIISCSIPRKVQSSIISPLTLSRGNNKHLITMVGSVLALSVWSSERRRKAQRGSTWLRLAVADCIHEGENKISYEPEQGRLVMSDVSGKHGQVHLSGHFWAFLFHLISICPS